MENPLMKRVKEATALEKNKFYIFKVGKDFSTRDVQDIREALKKENIRGIIVRKDTLEVVEVGKLK